MKLGVGCWVRRRLAQQCSVTLCRGERDCWGGGWWPGGQVLEERVVKEQSTHVHLRASSLQAWQEGSRAKRVHGLGLSPQQGR